MADKLKLIMNLETLSSASINEFISEFGRSIQKLVQDNAGSEEIYKLTLLDSISELYFRVRNGISFEKYDPEILIYTIAILVFKKNRTGNKRNFSPLILNNNFYERNSVKLLSSASTKKEEKCKELIDTIGEPGRTILKLSFFNRDNDSEIVKHVHFESTEQLRQRRIRLLDRCVKGGATYDDEKKIKIVRYLISGLSEEEMFSFQNNILSNDEGKKLLNEYKAMISQIDMVYSRKKIAEKLMSVSFVDLDNEKINNKKEEQNLMKNAISSWIQYPIMILIAFLVSWFVISMRNDSNKKNNTSETTELPIKDSIVTKDNRILSDEIKKGEDIMGIALNRTGFYLLPYSIGKLNAVFGSNQSMTNKLPLNIIWDDEEAGFAVAYFTDENLERLPNIPYRFSNDDYFLGEDLFFVFSTKSKISINKGIVIIDKVESNLMTVHLSLNEDVYGAVVMDKSGAIVGISEKSDSEGNVIVVKSKSAYQMIKEMNLDKGVTYISMPSQNYLRTKTNAQKIEILEPFMAWFNSK